MLATRIIRTVGGIRILPWDGLICPEVTVQLVFGGAGYANHVGGHSGWCGRERERKGEHILSWKPMGFLDVLIDVQGGDAAL